MPLPLTVSCFSKIQIGFTFLVPADLGSPEKGPLNECVSVCVSVIRMSNRRRDFLLHFYFVDSRTCVWQARLHRSFTRWHNGTLATRRDLIAVVVQSARLPTTTLSKTWLWQKPTHQRRCNASRRLEDAIHVQWIVVRQHRPLASPAMRHWDTYPPPPSTFCCNFMFHFVAIHRLKCTSQYLRHFTPTKWRSYRDHRSCVVTVILCIIIQ